MVTSGHGKAPAKGRRAQLWILSWASFAPAYSVAQDALVTGVAFHSPGRAA